MLLLCLLPMRYGYFQLVRFGALIGFGLLAYQANEHGKKTEMLIFVVLALLFQPFLKIALGRQLWNVIDVLIGISLLLSMAIKYTKSK